MAGRFRRRQTYHPWPACLAVILAAGLFASAAAAVSGGEVLTLTLREAVETALSQNLQLLDERTSSRISEAEITVQEGQFDPLLSLGVSESYVKNPPGVLLTGAAPILSGAEDRTVNAEADLSGKLVFGTTYELTWSNEKVTRYNEIGLLNPYYTSDIILSIRQPILKGAGRDVQEAGVTIARNNLGIARLKTDDRANGIIADTARSYWDLLAARDLHEVSEISLKLAKNLFDEVKARIDVGLLAPVDIYKAEAEVALREQLLLSTKNAISDAMDRLRAVMNVKDWDRDIVPAERPPKPGEAPPFESVLETARANRKDIAQLLVDKQNKEILLRFYENQRLPDISLFASGGLNGLNGTFNDAMDMIGSGDYYSWQIGVSVALPLRNRTAAGNALKAKYDLERTDVALKSRELQVLTEVREAWRSVKVAAEIVGAARKTRIAAEKSMEAEEGRFRVGMATVNDVLKFQEEYARALASEKKAQIDYARALVELERVKGTLWLGEFAGG